MWLVCERSEQLDILVVIRIEIKHLRTLPHGPQTLLCIAEVEGALFEC